jgi:hypothetical protein
MRGYDRRPSTLSAFLLGALFLLPPAGNAVWREWRHRVLAPIEDQPAAAGDGAAAALRVENARLSLELESCRRRLEAYSQLARQVPEIGGPGARFLPRPARAILHGDPSPRRQALWLLPEGDWSPSADAPLVKDGALVGRVAKLLPGGLPAIAQTIADPAFAVRFRSGELWGFLRGTGEHDVEGRALLEIQFLSAEAAIEAGSPLLSDGDDGVYPRGLLVAETLDPSRRGARGGQLARSPLALAGLNEVVVLEDRFLAALRRGAPGGAAAEGSDDGGEDGS